MTTTKAAPPVLGTGVDRVDGRHKVMGAAHYPSRSCPAVAATAASSTITVQAPYSSWG
jgi:hypothetical protein